jgi:hypothetical protein
MTEPTYQPGEIVTVIAENALVLDSDERELLFEYHVSDTGGSVARASIRHTAAGVSIRRIMPPDPPRLGEVWKDARGVLWLAVQSHAGVQLHDGGANGSRSVAHVQGQYGPIVPVYRDLSDGGETDG